MLALVHQTHAGSLLLAARDAWLLLQHTCACPLRCASCERRFPVTVPTLVILSSASSAPHHHQALVDCPIGCGASFFSRLTAGTRCARTLPVHKPWSTTGLYLGPAGTSPSSEVCRSVPTCPLHSRGYLIPHLSARMSSIACKVSDVR